MKIREMRIEFAWGVEVNAHYKSRIIPTDQPPPKGRGAAPAPFDLFLASIGTCAGYYVLNFCKQRDLPTNDVRIVQWIEIDETSHMVNKIELEIQVPPSFPEKYHQALIRSADQCAVKKHLENIPQLTTYTKVIKGEGASE